MEIQDYDLIICEDSFKMAILDYASSNHLLLNAKIMTKREFFQEYFYKTSAKTLSYVVKKYKVKVSIAKMYLDNLYFILDKDYHNPKLKFLSELKKDLLNHNLLKINPYFKSYLENKKILVRGYLTIEKWEEDVFNEYDVTYENIESLKRLEKVYEFKTLEAEINYVAEYIASLIDQGIDVNHIKLMNVDKSYYRELERIFNYYHIPLDIPSMTSLIGFDTAQMFLEYLNNNSLEESLNLIKDENEEVVRKIINILNNYVQIENKEDIIPLIKEDFKNTHLNLTKLERCVKFISIDDYVSSLDYVVLMNFTSISIPAYKKDEDYITDNLKNEVSLYNTYEYNKTLKNNVIQKLESINNLVITYKLEDDKEIFYPSSLVSLLDLEVIKNYKLPSIHYSVSYDLVKYTYELDNFKKYGLISEDLKVYQNNLDNPTYKTYDHTFKGIDNKSLKEYLGKGLTLSYSSLNNYNKCAFRYYLDNVLKLDPFEETFDTFIGSLFHDVLEKCLNNDNDIKEEVNNYLHLKEKILTPKEKFYVSKLMNDLKFVIDYLKNEKKYISLDKEYHEKYISIKKDKDIPVKFVGFVDKILYKEMSDATIVSIMDYKTGLVDINLNYVPYGMSLQLPIYLYLVSKSHLFKNPLYAGFYLQNILDKNLKRSDDYIKTRQDSLKLKGYSNKDLSILKYLDSSMPNSEIIKGLRLKSDGDFYSTSKVLSNEEINKLIEITENIIDKSIESILSGDFSINPKRIGYDKNVGCQYCPFKDICYKEEADFITLEDQKDLAFLGGI